MLKRVDSIENEPESNPAATETAVDGVALESTGDDAPLMPVAELETSVDQFEDDEFEEPTLWERITATDAQALLLSILLHTVLLLALAVFPLVIASQTKPLALEAAPIEELEELSIVEQVAPSDNFETEVGANSDSSTDMALSAAPVLAELPEVSAPSETANVEIPTIQLTNRIQQAVGLTRSEVAVQGMTGVGTTGTDGAVDRITSEILRAMEDRPTLVVWFFDQSGSLLKRRQEIRDRFDRIYEELGILGPTADEKKKDADQPLLTSVFAFGSNVNLLTTKPTANIDEVRSAIDSIEMDTSGVERVFSAVYKGVEKYKRYRSSSTGLGPKRNVMFIVVSDERGDDETGLEATIAECRKFAIPVYVVGVPAPFGREKSYVKYVDPDPNFDQTPTFAEVDQGPESILPERVKLGYERNYFAEPVIDSGFGPFALSRLCYETGGIYFTVHPNRRVGRRVRRGELDEFASNLEYFFDPEKMEKYRPDYLSSQEYMKRVTSSPLRNTLIQAARMARVDTLAVPTQRFVKTSDANLANALTAAQRQAARLEPQLATLSNVLAAGEAARSTETSPRWLAGYDLALGTVLAHKVRAETYNAMLAKAKRGMAFEKEKNNTWVLRPAKEITVGSRLEKEANKATMLLERVASEHKGTPWGLLASRELRNPIGWSWEETFTDLNPPARNRANPNNNNPRPPSDDAARMLKKPPPKRPVPKL